jgi:hypothetical protein
VAKSSAVLGTPRSGQLPFPAGDVSARVNSAKDPRYTIEPQKRRLAARRAAGITDDSITTAG